MTLPQLVPSAYCLRCRGCCIFSHENSEWNARLLAEEEILLERVIQGASFAGHLVASLLPNSRYYCRCLNGDDHYCRVYAARPLECALYPFLLSSEKDKSGQKLLHLYAHMACPFVQENRLLPEFTAYAMDIRRILALPANVGVLKSAATAYSDYSRFKDEVVSVADIPFNDQESLLLSRKAEIEEWISRRPSRLSACSFVNIFAWLDYFDFSMDEVSGNMLVFARQREAEFLYCPPFGAAINLESVEAAFARMKGGAARIEAVSTGELDIFDSRHYRLHEQGEEYYYERGRISALVGHEYHSKRGDCNLFTRARKPVFREFRLSDTNACHDLFDRWLDNRAASYKDDIFRAMLVENRAVHRRLIAYSNVLGLAGRVVEVGGVLVGYTFGYRLNDDTFCIALEVTEPGIKGLPAYIFHEFCLDDELKKFKYINAMDDFGMPGVAKAKRSWRPVFMEKIYTVCLKR